MSLQAIHQAHTSLDRPHKTYQLSSPATSNTFPVDLSASTFSHVFRDLSTDLFAAVALYLACALWRDILLNGFPTPHDFRLIHPAKTSIHPHLSVDLAFGNTISTTRERQVRELSPPLLPPTGQEIVRVDWPRPLAQLVLRGEQRSLDVLGAYTADPTKTMAADRPWDFHTYMEIYEVEEGRFEPAVWSLPLEDTSAIEVLTIEPYHGIGTPQTEEQWASLLGRLRSLTTLVVCQPWEYEAVALLSALTPRFDKDSRPAHDGDTGAGSILLEVDDRGALGGDEWKDEADGDVCDKPNSADVDEDSPVDERPQLPVLCPNLQTIEFVGMPANYSDDLYWSMEGTYEARVRAGCPPPEIEI
ncbi:hypothetical protein BC628DRAFT_551287 [Trametes gibbosa]|nr:hypothetical protein BC628DRAFT_551287 [Trametes gibbosa]